MLAIYEKELKSYFTSVIACLFIAVTTFIAGIFFIYYNLTYGYTQMYAAYNALLILVFTIPILTMKIVADERRLKTDQLILTSPISFGVGYNIFDTCFNNVCISTYFIQIWRSVI